MAYFNYHAKIQQKICDGKLISYSFCNDYENIGFAMVLHMDKDYPIREHKFEEYFELIGKLYQTKKVDGIYHTTFLGKW